ncbi:MAG: hypothetical protein CMH55_03850 [Myxococcales bacterium]|nr:hypothetical protein [Myxococcales bacterium]
MLSSPLLVALPLLIGGGPTTPDETVGAAAFAGRYQPVQAKRQAVTVGKAIDKSLANRNLLVRWRAGDILRQNNQIASEITISTQAGKMLIMTPLRKAWWTDLNGKPRSIITPRGTKATLSRSYESPRLIERFVSERGKRTHHISLSQDGQLMLWQVTVESKELAQPIRYTLKYRRR